MAVKLTIEQFVSRSREKHGDVYDYSKTVYTGARNNLTITCKLHGDFQQLPSNHMKGAGCYKCGVGRSIAAAKSVWLDPAYKAKCANRSKKLWETESYRSYYRTDEFLSKSRAGARTESRRINASAASKRMWTDPEYRAKAFGGSSGRSASSKRNWADPEYRAKIQKMLDTRYDDPEFAAKMRGIFGTDEKRKEKSAHSISMWESTEFRSRMKQAMAKESYKAQKRESLLRWYENNPEKVAAMLEKHRSPHELAKRSARVAKLWEDQEYRIRVSAAIKKTWSSTELRQRASEGGKVRANRPEVRLKMVEIRSRQPVVSSLNKAVFACLESLGVSYISEYAIGPWVFDVYIPSHEVLIECNGEYWHSLPKAIRNDKSKDTYVRKYASEKKLVTVWEVEFFKEGRLLHILKKILGLIEAKPENVDIHDIDIKEVDRVVASTLYSQHHYLGSVRGDIHFGAYYMGNLVATCSFGSFSRNQQTKRYKGAKELTRFCADPAYHAKNLGSKFLSSCLKVLGKPVVTYADTTQGHDGALYKACNFTLSHTVEPDYFYIDGNGWVMHKRTLWGRASKMSMSEADYAAKHGMVKKYGGEKLCFTYGL